MKSPSNKKRIHYEGSYYKETWNYGRPFCGVPRLHRPTETYDWDKVTCKACLHLKKMRIKYQGYNPEMKD